MSGIGAAAGAGPPCADFLSGGGETENKQGSFAAGFDHHLVKPIELDALERLLAAPAG